MVECLHKYIVSFPWCTGAHVVNPILEAVHCPVCSSYVHFSGHCIVCLTAALQQTNILMTPGLAYHCVPNAETLQPKRKADWDSHVIVRVMRC